MIMNVFRAVNKGGEVTGAAMTDQAIASLVGDYAATCGLGHIGAHDLRRTFAKLAHRGGAALDQIQLSLGHASLKDNRKILGAGARPDRGAL
jgi:integrase